MTITTLVMIVSHASMTATHPAVAGSAHRGLAI
jgi:hypothetical protein